MTKIYPPITLIYTGFKWNNHNEKVNTPVIIDHKRKFFGDMWTVHCTFPGSTSSNYIPVDHIEKACRVKLNLGKITTA